MRIVTNVRQPGTVRDVVLSEIGKKRLVHRGCNLVDVERTVSAVDHGRCVVTDHPTSGGLSDHRKILGSGSAEQRERSLGPRQHHSARSNAMLIASTNRSERRTLL